MPTLTAPEPSDVMPMTAVRTMERSFHRAVAGGVIAWQLFMVIAVLTASVRIPAVVLVAAHLALAAMGVGALLRMSSAVPLVLGIHVVGFVDLAAAIIPDGPLSFGAIWSLTVVAATPAFIMSRWSAVAVGTCVMGLSILELGVLHPDWPFYVTVYVVATIVVLIVATQLVMARIRAAAERADAMTLQEQQTRQRARVAARVGREIDEDARLLHDTLINTLGAIASGRGATRDPIAVRERCARDAATVAG